MHKFLQAAATHGRGHTPSRTAVVLTLAAFFLALLLAPAIYAAGAARAGHIANGAQTASLTKYFFATATAALLGSQEMVVSFALALGVGLLLIGTAELLWRFSRWPDSR